MSNSLKSHLTDAMKTAMKAGDKPRLSTVRLALAAIKQREVDERVELTDSDIVEVLTKMVKQRRDSIQHYQAGAREDLAAKEQAEIDILMDYLPAQMGEAEIDALIAVTIAEVEATSMRDMGQVMAALRPQVQGRADLQAVSAKVKARLSA